MSSDNISDDSAKGTIASEERLEQFEKSRPSLSELNLQEAAEVKIQIKQKYKSYFFSVKIWKLWIISVLGEKILVGFDFLMMIIQTSYLW